MSVTDGSRKLLCQPSEEVNNIVLSPDCAYALYYSPLKKNYFSYEISSGITRNITRHISTVWTTLAENDMPDSLYKNIGIAGWIKQTTSVLLYDQHDIWSVDLSGRNQPINITKGYGRKYNIIFNLPEGAEKSIVGDSDDIIATAFDLKTKNAGFYLLKLNGIDNPEQISMGPFSYEIVQMQPTGKRDSTLCLVKRMTAQEYPNFYFTMNFRQFRPISDLQPQKSYNWLKTELITWRNPDGHLIDGILYKPENFDPKTKYPIIIYYYERLSQKLNVFLQPEPAEGPINIPYFVSNGYLVFTPDIHYKIGEPGQSALNTVVSAAKYLSRFSWIDPTKMGIQGHSWGGFETNYIITHSNIFAAAVSAAGETDMISAYNNISHGGVNRQHYYEMNQTRLGTTLWQNPELFIKNSPIFRADKVTTPLMIMHNKNDGSVPISQSIELFIALRRLGKRVWMLQYDEDGHILGNRQSAKDYSIRLLQFFNHYLKGTLPPRWMTRSIPGLLQGTADDLSPDNEIRTPGPGLLIENESNNSDNQKKK